MQALSLVLSYQRYLGDLDHSCLPQLGSIIFKMISGPFRASINGFAPDHSTNPQLTKRANLLLLPARGPVWNPTLLVILRCHYTQPYSG